MVQTYLVAGGTMRTAVITAFVVSLVTSITFAQGVDFSGNWQLNTKFSQDPFEKIYASVGTEQLRGAGTAAYDAVNSATLLRDTDRAGTLRSLLDYAEVLETVEIEQADNELTVAVGAGDEFFSLFYLDGEKHARQLPSGLNVEATAAWEGESIHIVQVGENDAVLKEIYSLVGGGSQMALIFLLESNLAETPIQFRIVYDRVEGD